jgi:hypothetical protein
MEWLVIAALVIFVAGLVDVVRVAERHAQQDSRRRPPQLP